MLLRSIVLLAACLTVNRATFADVWVVGSGGLTVQGAVNLAHDGDVVLVHANVQENVVVSKGITIVADVPSQPLWVGTLHIQDVPAGRTFVISGFILGFTSTLVLSNNDGAIRIEDCHVSPTSVPMQPSIIAARCTACADVAFLRCSISGGSGVNSANGAAAIIASDSVLTIDDSSVAGGHGRAGYFDPDSGGVGGGPGGDAIVLTGGGVVLQSSTVHGGGGGDGWVGNCTFHATPGGAGGDGIVLRNGATSRAIGGTIFRGVGGTGGTNDCNQAPDGADGMAVNAMGGTWSATRGPNRTLVAPRIVREGDPLPLTFTGDPSEHVYLLVSSATAHIDSMAPDGVWLVQQPLRRIDFGTLDATGALSVALTTPDLADGVPNDLMHLQTVLIDAQGVEHLGCASIVVRLDAAY